MSGANKKHSHHHQNGDEDLEAQPVIRPLPSNPPAKRPSHARNYSYGNTMNAFPLASPPHQQNKQAPLAPAAMTDKQRIKKKRSKRGSEAAPPVPPKTGSDVGDFASMAILGLGDDIDMSGLVVGDNPLTSGPPPKRPPRNRQQQQSLPTISDHHEEHLDYSAHSNEVGKSRPGRKDSRRGRESLRYSDVSLENDAAMKAFQSGLQRNNPMFVSGDSIGEISPKGRRDDRFSVMTDDSLMGTHFMDASANSLPRQQQPTKTPHPDNNLRNRHKPQLSELSQQEEIMNFASLVQAADYGGTAVVEEPPKAEKHPIQENRNAPNTTQSTQFSQDGSPFETFVDEPIDEHSGSCWEQMMDFLDPTYWLTMGVKFNEDDVPYFDDHIWTPGGFVRHFLWNPISPEFTSLQQIDWAVILGVAMGFYTAYWKLLIEFCVDFMWETVPETLMELGLFTELDGVFPMYHYMWMCPAVFGGVLSYIFAALPTPIPGQNEWIENVHTQGVQGHETFFILFVLSTAGMASGLSLGPELPLILTAGMIGSWLGVICKQSVLQARVMNITCASAAIGGFFGFPMAGALFVMEVPHRMGLQYFEALSPATIASIVAVLVNRMIVKNDVTGYFSYPFLSASLPSEIFTSSIVYGVFGALVGIIYTKSVLFLKGWVHDLFHAPHDHDDHGPEDHHGTTGEKTPLMGDHNKNPKEPQAPTCTACLNYYVSDLKKYVCLVIPYEPHRAAASGVIAGTMVGVICLFLPHVMFWGEAQLQTLIDKGRTPLPVFGQGEEPTAALTALGYCMVDPHDGAAVRAGMGIACSFSITVAKIVVTGLSLGTGIIGGHFWGPLAVGCIASHFFTDVVKVISLATGYGSSLVAYPCVCILCFMGSTHVVTFRAHTAIMLILTLTISTFDPQDNSKSGEGVAGDYSAVFPLLVVSVFVSLMISRQTVFYAKQRSRGDIMALPEVLCEPGKEGMPMVLGYDDADEYGSEYSSGDEGYESDSVSDISANRSTNATQFKAVPAEDVTQAEIEKQFAGQLAAPAPLAVPSPLTIDQSNLSIQVPLRDRKGSSDVGASRSRGASPLPPRPNSRAPSVDAGRSTDGSTGAPSSGTAGQGLGELTSSRLDELLSAPLDYERPKKGSHRRIKSAPMVNFGKKSARPEAYERADSGGLEEPDAGVVTNRHTRSDSYSSQASGPLMQVSSFGKLQEHQPSLMDQARLRSSSSVVKANRHVRHPSLPRFGLKGHSRQNSSSSIGSAGKVRSHSRQNSSSSIGSAGSSPKVAALSSGEVERAMNQQSLQDRKDA